MRLEITIARNNREEEIKLISSEWLDVEHCAEELSANLSDLPEYAKNDIIERMVEELKKIYVS